MRLRTRLAAAAASAALVTGAVVATAPVAGAADTTAGTKIAVALTTTPGLYQPDGDGNPYDWDIVTRVIASDPVLLGALTAQTSLTVFAPNDRAFEVLAKRLGLLPSTHRFGATVDEKAILAGLGKVPAATVQKIVLYHVYAKGAVSESAARSLPVWGTRLQMANGQNLGITNFSRFTGGTSVFLIDRDGSYFNDRVIDARGDLVVVPGGVVHGITDVLLPTL